MPDEKRGSAPGFLARDLRWFRASGIRVERVMTDNGSCYRSRLFAKALRWLGIRHIRTRLSTPITTGKVERFIQTLMREWAYAFVYLSSGSRTADLRRWLDRCNQHGPTSALDEQPLLQALNNVVRAHFLVLAPGQERKKQLPTSIW